MKRLAGGLLLGLAIVAVRAESAPTVAAKKLRIGVTLHPYYSWVANIVADRAEVVPVLPGTLNPHSYQPRPADVQNLVGLDAIVVNGLGHDDFIEPLLQAADRKDIHRIRPNDGLPLIANNPHTFLSITSAIQQIHTIARELGTLDPANAELYRENARAYCRRLRGMLARALQAIADLDVSRARIATVHDGYAYLFQELGLEVTAVVQPRHGIEPSAKQLADTIERIKAAGVNLLFTEMDLQSKYVNTIYDETGCRVLRLSHVASGEYTPEKFEQDMQQNLDTIVQGLRSSR